MAKIFIFTVLVFAAIIMYTKAKITGGLSESQPANTKVTELVERQKANIFKKICDNGSSCPAADATIVVNSFKTQSVSGINYFISVTIGGTTVYHVRIYNQPWTQTEAVHAVRGPKEASDEISSFA